MAAEPCGVGEALFGTALVASVLLDRSLPNIITIANGLPDDAVKLPGAQGYRDSKGNTWTKDRLHKDHWDVVDKKGNKVKEIDFNGRQIWPGGPKNKNKGQ